MVPRYWLREKLASENASPCFPSQQSRNGIIEMNADLAALLTAISPENLAVAHDTSRAKYPGGKSPYKPLLLLAVFASVNQRRPNFYRGWFRPADALGPFIYLHATIFPTLTNC